VDSSVLKYNYNVEKLNCHIAPSRKDADILIYRRHTTTPIKRWETVSQDAHIHKLFSEDGYSIEEISSTLGESTTNIRKALRRYNIHQFSMSLFDDNPSLKEAISSDKFPITNIERLYDYRDGMDFLGISFAANGEINRRLDADEVKKRLRFIVEEVVNENFNSRIFNKDIDKKEYIEYLKSLTDKFDYSKPLLDHPAPVDEEPISIETKPSKDSEEESKRQPSNRQYKLFSDKNWAVGNKRINSIFSTMKTIRFDKHVDVVSIVFRCYLEMIVYEFLKKKNCIGDASIQENAKMY